jgi:hypothetical protein
VRASQYFAIERDGVEIDTSQVWYRVDASDPSRILLGLKNNSITLDHDWRITYDATSEADRAPLATIDPGSGDTIFATAFFELPVRLDRAPVMGVQNFRVERIAPNPTGNVIRCSILAFKHETIDVAVRDERGAGIRRNSFVVEEGLQNIAISSDGLASGTYWIELSNESGMTVERAVVIR